MKVLIVIDMQHDFVDGSLRNVAAQKIVPELKKLISSFDGAVCFTRDTHQANYLKTQEGRFLPVEHCIEGTFGHDILGGLIESAKDKRVYIYDKPTFGMPSLPQKLLEDVKDVTEILLAGVCTDICVISNALILKASLPEIPVSVSKACTAGLTEEKHLHALDVMQSCQVLIV